MLFSSQSTQVDTLQGVSASRTLLIEKALGLYTIEFVSGLLRRVSRSHTESADFLSSETDILTRPTTCFSMRTILRHRRLCRRYLPTPYYPLITGEIGQHRHCPKISKVSFRFLSAFVGLPLPVIMPGRDRPAKASHYLFFITTDTRLSSYPVEQVERDILLVGINRSYRYGGAFE